MGLVRDLAITAILGAAGTIAADAYYTALTFPNLFRRIFAEGAFAAAFVPAYSKKLAADGEEAADRMASDSLATVALAAIVLTAVAQLAMPWIMTVYSYGYLDDPAKFKLTVILTQITMPYLPCMVIAALFSGTLNAHGRFIISGFYPTVLNLVMLAMVLPQKDPVHAAYALAIGVIIAGVSQAALVWWGARRSGVKIRLVRPRLTPDVRRLLKTAVPAAVANSATQINLVISAALASGVAGMRSWMNVADRFYQLPMSLVGVAIGIALLPRLSQALASDDHDDAKAAMDQGLLWALALSLPAAAALIAMPNFLVDGLFTRGKFLASDAQSTGLLLFHYGWGVPAFVLLRILQPTFFARGDTRLPMAFSLVSVAVNAILAIILFKTLGFYGVAIATSAAAWVNVILLWITIRRAEIYRADGRMWFKSIRVAAAAAGMGGLLALAVWQRPAIEAALGHKEIAVLVVSIAGALAYLVLLFALGGVSLAEARAMMRRRRA